MTVIKGIVKKKIRAEKLAIVTTVRALSSANVETRAVAGLSISGWPGGASSCVAALSSPAGWSGASN